MHEMPKLLFFEKLRNIKKIFKTKIFVILILILVFNFFSNKKVYCYAPRRRNKTHSAPTTIWIYPTMLIIVNDNKTDEAT